MSEFTSEETRSKNNNLRELSEFRRGTMRGGTTEFQTSLLTAIPPQQGEMRKHWLHRAARVLRLQADDLHYYFYDRDSRPDKAGLTLDALQRATSAHSQSVKRCAELLNVKQGEIQHELSAELETLLAEALKLVRSANTDRR